MCTLSLFKVENGYRVFMNRDERHDRLAEKPPQILSERFDVYGPLDPVSNGTWVAHNNRFFWGCLLNGYLEEEGAVFSASKSRGEILLDILSQDDPVAYARDFNALEYSSFRLVVGSTKEHALYVWDGVKYQKSDFHASYKNHAFFLSSSSWRQTEVIESRRHLFENWVQNNDVHGIAVPEFHYSQEPNPESAPMMYRSYSRTQSVTALAVSKSGANMRYERVLSDNDV